MTTNESANIIRNVLSASSFLMVNKHVAKEVGINAAILLAELISKEEYWEQQDALEDGFFYNTQETIEESTTLSLFQQRQACAVLVKKGLLETKYDGLPRKLYYKAVKGKIVNLLKAGIEQSERLVLNKVNINNNKEIIIKNKKKIEDIHNPQEDCVCNDSTVILESSGDDQNEIIDQKLSNSKYTPRGLTATCTKEENKDIAEIIHAFSQINPMISYTAISRTPAYKLLKKFGFKKTSSMIKYALSIQGERYAPVIDTPNKLIDKLGALRIYYHKNQQHSEVIKKY